MPRIGFLNVEFDRVDMQAALLFVTVNNRTRPFRYVVTPNVDHLVRLAETTLPQVRDAYAGADLCLCDSRIVQLLARLRGIRLEAVAGSDLIEALIPHRLSTGIRILLIGGSAEVADRLRDKLPHAMILQHCPPMRMLEDQKSMDTAVDFIVAHPSDLILLAVGSPQQEIIAYRTALTGNAKGTALCIGAGIEFLVGVRQRAPKIWRGMALEWLFRLLNEPRRLWWRYLIHSPRILLVFVRWREKNRVPD